MAIAPSQRCVTGRCLKADHGADLQHHLFALTLDGKLFQAPVRKDANVQRILDVGTGTGIWAMDVGMAKILSASRLER